MVATTNFVIQKDFYRLIYYKQRFAGPVLEKLLAEPDACFRDARAGRRLKHDRTTTLVKITDDNRDWVAKRYNTKNLWHALRRCFSRSRAINCWEMSHALQAAGLRTADPIAVLEQRFGPLRRRSFYFSKYLTGTSLEKIITPNATPDQLDHMSEVFTGMFTKLAVALIAHGDMKFTNFLLVENEIALLDLDAAKVYSTARYAPAYRKDRARFLRNWQHIPEFHRQLSRSIPVHPVAKPL